MRGTNDISYELVVEWRRSVLPTKVPISSGGAGTTKHLEWRSRARRPRQLASPYAPNSGGTSRRWRAKLAAAEGDEPVTPKILLTELLEVALSEAIRDRLGARSHSSGPESDHHRMRPAKQKVTTGEW